MRKFLAKTLRFVVVFMLFGTIAACSQGSSDSGEKAVTAVMLDYNGGVGTVGSFEIEKNAQYTLETPQKKGYEFVCWKKDGEEFAQSGKWTEAKEYVVLVAEWELQTYSITYEQTGGLSHQNPVSYTVENATITLLAPDGEEDFLGWYDKATGGVQVKTIDTSLAEPIVLYGRWKTSSEDDGWSGRYEG